MHAEDLIKVERMLGFRYEIAGSEVEHYQWICPHCRRALIALAQGQLCNTGRAGMFAPETAPLPRPRPQYANPGLNEGPLGEEDRANFHP